MRIGTYKQQILFTVFFLTVRTNEVWCKDRTLDLLGRFNKNSFHSCPSSCLNYSGMRKQYNTAYTNAWVIHMYPTWPWLLYRWRRDRITGEEGYPGHANSKILRFNGLFIRVVQNPIRLTTFQRIEPNRSKRRYSSGSFRQANQLILPQSNCASTKTRRQTQPV